MAVEAIDHCYIGGLHNKPVSIDGSEHTDDLGESLIAASVLLLQRVYLWLGRWMDRSISLSQTSLSTFRPGTRRRFRV